MPTEYYISVDKRVEITNTRYDHILLQWKTIEERFPYGKLKLAKKVYKDTQNCDDIPIKYKRYTKGEIVLEHGLHNSTFDYALPQGWVDNFINVTGIDPVPLFVWLYPKNMTYGIAYPLTSYAKFWLTVYNEKENEK